MKKVRDPSWDFKGVNTKILTHGLHSYPAMMIPQVARKSLEIIMSRRNIEYVFDPFMGSGTTLVESMIHNVNSIGFDINPLAVLVSKVKTTPINPKILDKEFRQIIKNTKISIGKLENGTITVEKPDYFNIDLWFKPKVINHLLLLKNEILKIEDKDVKDFFKVCFSETVRKVSNSKKGEMKVYRMSPEKLKKWNPNVLQTFIKITENNIGKMSEFYKVVKNVNVTTQPLLHNILDPIDLPGIDLVLTSPPYGDSKTTVAYGNFSKLSLQWLDYEYDYIRRIDKISLGGVRTKNIVNNTPSRKFDEIINILKDIDEKRTKDVVSFFNDLYKSIKIIDKYVNNNGYVVFVVANRRVRDVRIPTDEIIVEMFEHLGYEHEITYVRRIPSKRIPFKVPSTVDSSKKVSSMKEENIIFLRKL